MPALPLRRDFDAKSCRLAVRHSGDAVQPRRLVLIATIYSGASRNEAAALGDVTVQIVCGWFKKFNAHGPGGLINRGPTDGLPKLTAEQLVALVAIRAVPPRPMIPRGRSRAPRREFNPFTARSSCCQEKSA